MSFRFYKSKYQRVGFTIAGFMLVGFAYFQIKDVNTLANANNQYVNRKCPSGKNFINENIAFASAQLSGMLQKEKNPKRIPKTTNPDGSLQTVNIYDWGSGFFAGMLWRVYELTNDEKWKQEAAKWTAALEPIKTFTGHHDIGFIMYSSFGNGYRLTGNENYKKILIRSAESLASRYDPKVGLIKSWDHGKAWDGKTEWFYPVIIDNMMNLELLFFASQVTGNPYFKNIAISHAEKTMKNHIRDDYSSYHVLDYDSVTGAVKFKGTNQGYTNESTWARGQAWGIYGFTMVYRETKDKRFLETAEGMADYFIHNKNLPADKIPYWDFNAPDTGYHPEWPFDPNRFSLMLKDASTSAVACSALFELSKYSGTKGKEYLKVAKKMLCSLGGPAYRARSGENNNFLLMHSVGSIPDGLEIDVPLNYADYYFLEALEKYKELTYKE